TLCIRIENFNRLARHRCDNVTRTRRIATWHIFDCWDEGDDVDRQLQAPHGFHYAENTGCAAHVKLHFVHIGAGLQRDATGIEGDSLADEHDRLRIATFHMA